jgi:predicted amidohydrolase
MMSKTTVAAVQMVSTADVDDNLETARRLLREAAEKGAKLVTLPEYWPIMGMLDTDKVGHAEQPGHGRSRISWRRRRASTASG